MIDQQSIDMESAKRAFIRLADGDIHGAIRSLCSEETYSLPDLTGLALLQAKHPIRQHDRRATPSSIVPPLSVSNAEVLTAVRSFNPGSSGGVDSLRPQHIQDMLYVSSAESLLSALTDFVNLILSGGLPLAVRPAFFKGRLHALEKKKGGLRPIAVGMSVRRLVAKVPNSYGLKS